MRLRNFFLVAIVVLGLAIGAVWWFAPSIMADAQRLLQRETLEVLVTRAGIWGPLLVIGLMTLAVVVSPIPSAPIALAAGAAYGQVWGTVQVVIGAELGAVLAFALARWLGREALRNWFGDRVDAGLLGSQNALMWAVFASRLMPFVSFDLMSNAAGLSGLRVWRFALATLAGIIPASFFLAYVCNEASSGDMGRVTWAVLGLGLITGGPLLWVAFRRKKKQET